MFFIEIFIFIIYPLASCKIKIWNISKFMFTTSRRYSTCGLVKFLVLMLSYNLFNAISNKSTSIESGSSVISTSENMAITNDVALITFVPFAVIALEKSQKQNGGQQIKPAF